MSRFYTAAFIVVFFLNCSSAQLLPSGVIIVGPEISTTTTSEVPPLEDSKYYAHFTGAVYCDKNLTTWTCPECIATGPSVQLIRVINNTQSDTRAIINTHSTKQQIIITFRGTLNANNLLANSDTTLIQPYPSEALKVHKGNWDALTTLYPDVTTTLREQVGLHTGWTIVITGHSLGGVLSSFMLLKLRHDPEFANLIYAVYTYGQRRAGDQAFATWLNAQNFFVIRVVNRADIIPQQTLQSQGYLHINTELWINGTTKDIVCRREVFEDNLCSNSRQIYNFADHLYYWNVDYTKCPIENYILVSPTLFRPVYDQYINVSPL